MLRTLFSSPVSVTETVLARATHATHTTQSKPHPVATFTLEHLSGLPAADFSTPARLLIWADDGDFVLEVNQQKILCHVGDALLLNSGRHCRLLPYHAPLTPNMHSLGLSAEWIGSFNLNYNALAQRQRHARLHAAGCQEVCSLPNLLQQPVPEFVLGQLLAPAQNSVAYTAEHTVEHTTEEQEDISEQFQAQTLVHLLLNALVNHNPQVISILCDHVGQPLASQVRALVMADLSRSWSIPELAQACHMSEATLRRKATQEVGSLVNFIHEIKMLEALRLLRQSALPITEIAGNLGYGSAAYFSSLFHQRFAMCPRELRKQPQSIE
ncbi:helix-turn-helix transcriptional regulator [Plesiomonas shigelloides]|uniref:helix-turn-helix transcriptional regulator n=1 Tax=Plesiomonas shigelloides TaxID=703 RepID=UPI003EBE318E